MDKCKLLIDLHKQDHRQGPGGGAETEQALIAMSIPQGALSQLK
jgi:hypothetical protein